jgi:hypothetical protein
MSCIGQIMTNKQIAWLVGAAWLSYPLVTLGTLVAMEQQNDLALEVLELLRLSSAPTDRSK